MTVVTIRFIRAEDHVDDSMWVRNSVAIMMEERLAMTIKRPEAFVNMGFVP